MVDKFFLEPVDSGRLSAPIVMQPNVTTATNSSNAPAPFFILLDSQQKQ
jgi:hypothetical protein